MQKKDYLCGLEKNDMMKRKGLIKTALCAMLLLAGGVAEGQSVRLARLKNRTDISLDLDRLYNYNNYEHNRWGLGFDITVPLKYDERYGTLFQNLAIVAAYAGYGTADHAWKFGGSAGMLFPRSVVRGFHVMYQHDLLRVGSHSFDNYNLFNTSNNSSYFSSRYAGVDVASAVLQVDIPGPGELLLEYSHSRERYLFDAHGLLYPSRYEADTMPYSVFNEVGLDLYWGKHWKLGLLANLRREDPDRNLYNILPGIHYVRLLVQYNNRIELKNNRGRLSLFAQGGAVLDDAPLSRRFDLGGTGGGRYYFNNTLLTVRPNTFMADAFALASLRYTAGFSLWKSEISNPQPFVQLGAVWGVLYGKDVVDDTKIVNLAPGSPIAITAPFQGLLEPGIGIDKLLHWGVLDMGVAAAYQLTNKNSPYHLDNFFNKFAVMVVANLVIGS